LSAVFRGRTGIFRVARPSPDFPRTELRGVCRHSAAAAHLAREPFDEALAVVL
jgi:hypothetical protein